MKKQKIYLLIGLPGSGKSTWAKKEIKKNNNLVIISRDEIRQMLNGEYIYREEQKSLITRIMSAITLEAIYDKKDIIIDQMNLTIETRQEVTRFINFAFLRGDSHEKIFVYFNEQKDNLERRMTNSRGISKEENKKIIKKMKQKIQEIEYTEDYDSLIIIDNNGKVIKTEKNEKMVTETKI